MCQWICFTSSTSSTTIGNTKQINNRGPSSAVAGAGRGGVRQGKAEEGSPAVYHLPPIIRAVPFVGPLSY